MEGRYYHGGNRKTEGNEASTSRCAKWCFYILWVVLIIYLLPNPNANWRMTTSDSSKVTSDTENLLQQPEDFESISAQVQGLHSYASDDNDHQFFSSQRDFLFKARSGELEQELIEAKEARINVSGTSNGPSKPKTYFAIFSGRQRYLEILFRYVTKFLDDGLIDEVHLWDFCRKTEDADYIAGVANMDPRYVIKGNGKKLRKIVRYQLPLYAKQRTDECLSGNLPPWVRVGYYCNIELLKLHILWKTMTHKMFPLFYKYYAYNMEDEDILVKCDDDVLFIDNLQPFVDFARNNPQISVTYPSIVNNELAAHFQMRENMIPDPRLSQLYIERWPLYEDLNEIFTTLSYGNFYEEHSEKDYGPKLRTAWFQTYAAAWFLHDTFLKDPARFHSEAVYLFEAPTRVSINMFAMRGETCRKFFVQSDFLTDRLTDDEEALTWRMQKAFGTTNAFYLNTTCVHYSFSRQLLDLDQANKTFIHDFANLAAELGNEPHYQPENTLYYGEKTENSTEIGTNLIIGKASVQIEALKALANLKTGGMSKLGEAAREKRLSKKPPQKKPAPPPQKKPQPAQNKPEISQNKPVILQNKPARPQFDKKPGMQQNQNKPGTQLGNNMLKKPQQGPGMQKRLQNGPIGQNHREMQKRPLNGQIMQRPQNGHMIQRPPNGQGKKTGWKSPIKLVQNSQGVQGPGQNKPGGGQFQQKPNQPTQKAQAPNMPNQPNQTQPNEGQAQKSPLYDKEAQDAATKDFLASISAGPS